MRLFIALDIDDAIRERIALFQDGVRGFAPDAGWVHPESLHVTLKFIGEKPDAAVEQIRDALSSVSLNPFSLAFRGTGFFPTAKSPRVFWLGIEAGPELAALAAKVDTTMESFGIPKEAHAYSPHLTLARGPRGSGAPRWKKGDHPNTTFARLQQKLAQMPTPEFGTMTAREFFLYQSKLQRGGAKYAKLARFSL
jgi:2'-5' RNA ligase